MTHDTPPKRDLGDPDTSALVMNGIRVGIRADRRSLQRRIHPHLEAEACAAALWGAVDAVSERADWRKMITAGRCPELFARVVEAILNTAPQPPVPPSTSWIAEARTRPYCNALVSSPTPETSVIPDRYLKC